MIMVSLVTPITIVLLLACPSTASPVLKEASMGRSQITPHVEWDQVGDHAIMSATSGMQSALPRHTEKFTTGTGVFIPDRSAAVKAQKQLSRDRRQMAAMMANGAAQQQYHPPVPFAQQYIKDIDPVYEISAHLDRVLTQRKAYASSSSYDRTPFILRPWSNTLDETVIPSEQLLPRP